MTQNWFQNVYFDVLTLTGITEVLVAVLSPVSRQGICQGWTSQMCSLTYSTYTDITDVPFWRTYHWHLYVWVLTYISLAPHMCALAYSSLHQGCAIWRSRIQYHHINMCVLTCRSVTTDINFEYVSVALHVSTCRCHCNHTETCMLMHVSNKDSLCKYSVSLKV